MQDRGMEFQPPARAPVPLEPAGQRAEQALLLPAGHRGAGEIQVKS